MVTKSLYGMPVETGAVVQGNEIKEKALSAGKICSVWPFEWKFKMDSQDVVYGLGESMRGINKRGGRYASWCSDTPHQEETTESLYGAHNFLIIFGKKTFGLFFDTASRIEFDIGFTNQNEIVVKCCDTGIVLYEIYSDLEDGSEGVLKDIVNQFRKLIGQSYIAPYWGFGFQQSRWGYKTEKDVRSVVEKYHSNKMPLDMVCLDIDYMEEYADFTVDKEKFPDLKKLCGDLREQGVRLIPIIDAGVKIKEGYSVYEEGIKNNFFCLKKDGTPFAAGVWPGRSHFTDFFKEDARQWFGSKYKVLTDCGIEGFWNDMNEPATFYSDESLAETDAKIRSVDISNLDINTFFDYSGLSGSTSNRLDDYQRFYHEVTMADGSKKLYRHDEVHNLYGGLMTRSAGEALSKIMEDRQHLLYSRASCIGAHRYGGIWTGDCNSWWAHLEQEIKVLPSLNMVGFIYSGADIGGFGCNTTRDLVLRWTSLGVFTPLMRNHSSWNTREQECYAFENMEDFKSMLDLRYALIPYLYDTYVKAVLDSQMYFKPLAFDFSKDKMSVECEDQLLLGDELMIAPVYRQNATGRYVYLPEDMTQVTWINSKPAEKVLEKGVHWVEMPLNSVVFFVRKGKKVPVYMSKSPVLSTKDITMEKLDKSCFVNLGKI